MIIDYYNLSEDKNNWTDGEKELYRFSAKNYHELKIRLSREMPELYSEVIKRLDMVKILDEDIELSVILAMKNKLSHEGKHMKITLLVTTSDRLTPQVIGYFYEGIIEE